jgi:hypothetical protein
MHAGRLTTLVKCLLIAAVLPGLLAHSAAGQVRGDFNGDGFSDLAIGVPNEALGRTHDAGSVNVIYGSAGAGLRALGNQVWHQGIPGIEGNPEDNDRFGWSLTSGDFNRDGYSDLAIGVVAEAVGPIAGAGQVSVIYGSPIGLVAAGNQIFHQNLGGVEDEAEVNDNFGFAVAAGDFNRDGFDDLAVGIPGEGVAALLPRVNASGIIQLDDFGLPIFDPVEIARAGAVQVFFGSAGGLVVDGNEIFHQEAQFLGLASLPTGIAGVAWDGDRFGSSLVAGDFNGDLASDLAIGVPGEELGFLAIIGGVAVSVESGLPLDTGAVNVLFSDWSGLSAEGSQFLHQNVIGTQAIAEAGDGFGAGLAAGDFNGDRFDDLAVGVPFDDIGRKLDQGAVHVLYGFHEGLEVLHDCFLHQDITDVKGLGNAEELFGLAVSAGDYDGDGFDDLAVGTPRDNVGRVHFAGSINVFYGRRLVDGCIVPRNQQWHQRVPGIQENSENWDQFGSSLASGDFNGDGRSDLAIGVFNESRLGINGAGAVNVLYGRSLQGLRAGGNQLWDQALPAILGHPEPVDWFGFSLASGN